MTIQELMRRAKKENWNPEMAAKVAYFIALKDASKVCREDAEISNDMWGTQGDDDGNAMAYSAKCTAERLAREIEELTIETIKALTIETIKG